MTPRYRVRLKPQALAFLFFPYYRVEGYVDYTYRYDPKAGPVEHDWTYAYRSTYKSHSLTLKGIEKAKARVVKKVKKYYAKEAKLNDLEASLKALEETVYL